MYLSIIRPKAGETIVRHDITLKGIEQRTIDAIMGMFPMSGSFREVLAAIKNLEDSGQVTIEYFLIDLDTGEGFTFDPGQI